MAYPSRGGSSRGTSGRAGGSGAGRSGGGANVTAYAVAGILVVLVVVLFLVLGKKKPTATLPPPVVPVSPPVVLPPPKAGAKPYPTITEAMLNEGRNLVRTFDKDAATADRLVSESVKAKGTGDIDTQQSKLREARGLYTNIKNQWNDFIDRLPTGNGYETEDVAKHYFARESGQVQKYLKNLAAMKTDQK